MHIGVAFDFLSKSDLDKNWNYIENFPKSFPQQKKIVNSHVDENSNATLMLHMR